MRYHDEPGFTAGGIEIVHINLVLNETEYRDRLNAYMEELKRVKETPQSL